MTKLAYAELHCHSYFSLLDGASSPERLVEQAKELNLSALALTDHDSLAGAVRFWRAAKHHNLHAILGAEITLTGGYHLTLLAEIQKGYANLCRLLSAARLDQLPKELSTEDTQDTWLGKVAPALTWERLAAHKAGLIALTGCRKGPIASPLLGGNIEAGREALAKLYDIYGKEHLYVELQHHGLADDNLLLRQLLDLAQPFSLSYVATNNVHYANQAESRLRDALIAIDHNQSLKATRRASLLPLNSNYALTSAKGMERRFQELPLALQNTITIAKRCEASLDFSSKRLPSFPTPASQSEFSHLYEMCHAQLPQRYPELKPIVLKQLAHELDIIEHAGLAGYFLIVWDIVHFARQTGIRSQGRGSAANSIVAYLLGITTIDPLQHNLLFERFLSEDKFTMPDIDIDFAADRREEVIQYVYRRYGAEHTAMVCNVVTYQARSALRDLAKALDFPQPVIDRLAKAIDTHSPTDAAQKLRSQIADEDAPNHPLRLLAELMQQIDGCPRHLSIHSGGMLITNQPLQEIVPLEPATMPGRIVCQWDKDSIEDTGLIKIDVLGLRTLGLISEALETIKITEGQAPNLDTIPLDDQNVYRMLQSGDTIGTFQVESRAQQQMLPRLKPQFFEDIAIEVAIVRPGPIQGGAVHPYLRRRRGEEVITYLHPKLEPVLKETLGVLLFQEQAIRVATAAAGFSPGEADLLRRALSRNRAAAEMAALRERFIYGAQSQGIDASVANDIFAQLAGFAGYGFCKSHAMSFALIAYQTLYLKHYHAPAFYCALLNHQPMGFYSPEVVLGDAKRHGVDLLPVEINQSDWRYTLEQDRTKRWYLRAGLNTITGLGEQGWARIQVTRNRNTFTGLDDFCHRTYLHKDTVQDLIRAGAFDGFGERRHLLWELGTIEYRPNTLDLPTAEVPIHLPPLDILEQTLWEYELLGWSANTQLMAHYRPQLRRQGIFSIWEVKQSKAGQWVQVAGMVVVRQRPGTAKGILFMSLEDESGLLDVVVKPLIYEQFRELLRSQTLLMIEGYVQRVDKAVNVLMNSGNKLTDVVL